MKRKKFCDITHKTNDLYVYAVMKATEDATSEYIYYLYCGGEVVLMDAELSADDVRCLINCLQSALKATGEWKEEGGGQ